MIKQVYKNRKRIKFSSILICIMFLYPLFAMTRFKQVLSPNIDKFSTTNEVWIIPLLLCIKRIFWDLEKERKYNLFMLILFISLLSVILVGGFRVENLEQYVYAILILIIPINLLFLCKRKDINNLNFFLKLFTAICLIYSLGYIFATSNYDFLSKLMGNTIYSRSFISSDQHRAKLMIGSAITVANYFTMSLPILFYVYFRRYSIRWNAISLISIIFNLIASALTLSRLGFFSSILIAMSCIFFQIESKNKFAKRFLIIILAILGFSIIMIRYDIGRLFMGFHDTSVLSRLSSIYLGIYIFQKNPLFGSGMGSHFTRLYTDNSLKIDDLYGLIDPHNVYVLILSEIGLIGLIIIILFILCLFYRLSQIPDKMFRKTSYLIVFAAAISGIGGSHLVNEISYSIVFWIYMSFFYSASYLGVREFEEISKNKCT
ncbi:O-antigen ligase family protein [Clostridium tertium]|uniref:O-antigen ligase family protein n=1 Tax=Clostridium tertium TaxID=1559 RepID=UPI0023B34FA5|nr:O-antigen ligase family protein [Clostridium tertium]